MLTRIRVARVHTDRAVDSLVAGLTHAARHRVLLLHAHAATLAHVVALTRSSRLTVAAGERPLALALVRVDAVDAEATVVASGIQTLVYVLLALVASEAGLAAAKVAGRRRFNGSIQTNQTDLILVVGVYERLRFDAVAVAVGRARIGRAWHHALSALNAGEAGLALAKFRWQSIVGRVVLELQANATVVALELVVWQAWRNL